jgi:hypothetical protein
LFPNEQAMKETAVYSCKISGHDRESRRQNAGLRAATQARYELGMDLGWNEKKKATLEDVAFCQDDRAFFRGLGGARSPRESSIKARLRLLVEVY